MMDEKYDEFERYYEDNGFNSNEFVDMPNLEDEFENELKKSKKSLKKAKIMLIGGTGVGKSSLVNVVFGKNLAKVGHGVPTSRGIEKFEIPERDIIIYDSEGYEIGEDKLEYFNSNIISTIETEGICTVWYCISTPNSRITDYDKEIIERIKSYNIPVHVVLTQADKSNPTKAQQMKTTIKEECKVESFLVTTNYINILNSKTNKPYGYIELENLLKFTTENITDENIRFAFAREQKCSLEVKEQEAVRIVNQHVAGNVIVGFTPIPLSDAPLLLASQIAMISRLILIYELEEQESGIKGLVQAIGIQGLMQQGGKMAAKYALGQALKFIPGLGTAGGGIINGAVAATFTKTLGYTVSKICYKMKEDEINNTNKTGFLSGPTAEMFLNIFKQQAQN
ncbi:MAG: GTPase [Cetobacterium sp.]